MSMTRCEIADAVDELDEQIAALQAAKADLYAGYREELAASMRKADVAAEVAALKKGIAIRRKRRTAPADAQAAEDLVEEVLAEIEAEPSRATRTTRARAREIIDEFPDQGVDIPQGIYMSGGDGWTAHLPSHNAETGELGDEPDAVAVQMQAIADSAIACAERESREEGVAATAPTEACNEAAIGGGVEPAETAPVANSGNSIRGLAAAIAVAREAVPDKPKITRPAALGDPEIPAFLDRRPKSAVAAAAERAAS